MENKKRKKQREKGRGFMENSLSLPQIHTTTITKAY